jgi:hypothetical protein
MSLDDDLRHAVEEFLVETDPPRSVNWTAKKLGVPTPSLHHWLKGDRTITLDTAAKIAAGLGLTLQPERRAKQPRKKRSKRN